MACDVHSWGERPVSTHCIHRGRRFYYRRRWGDSLIVANSSPVEAEPCRVYVNELARVLATQALLLVPITDVLQAQLSVYQDLFHLQGEAEFDGASFMSMKKI